MIFNKENTFWVNQPSEFKISENEIVIHTEPGTDFWQRTYYGFQNDNAPALLTKTGEKYFSFVVKTEFDSKRRFDQCGVILYQNCDNWLKASIEYENNEVQRLGSVVTNHGYSDWSTTDIDVSVRSMWYRISRRESDYCLECSADGVHFKQMRICHMWEGGEEIQFGIYACSPENSSFEAKFTHMAVTECMWRKHE